MLLIARQWHKADVETCRLLLLIANRTLDGWLRGEDLEKIDCLDFFLIDRLWQSHSNKRFGLAIQLAVYQEYLGDLVAFSQRTGWSLFQLSTANNNENLLYPSGYFPYRYKSLFMPTKNIHLIDRHWCALFFARLSLCEI